MTDTHRNIIEAVVIFLVVFPVVFGTMAAQKRKSALRPHVYGSDSGGLLIPSSEIVQIHLHPSKKTTKLDTEISRRRDALRARMDAAKD